MPLLTNVTMTTTCTTRRSPRHQTPRMRLAKIGIGAKFQPAQDLKVISSPETGTTPIRSPTPINRTTPKSRATPRTTPISSSATDRQTMLPPRNSSSLNLKLRKTTLLITIVALGQRGGPASRRKRRQRRKRFGARKVNEAIGPVTYGSPPQ